jgi:glycosyltransferase involved in cell wall biosynthesis
MEPHRACAARLPGAAAVLSFSPIAGDQRVLRQIEVLSGLGYEPLVVGYGRPQDLPGRFLALSAPRPTIRHRLATLLRQLPAHVSAKAASIGFWTVARHRTAYRELVAARPRLLVVNDWPALVVGARVKRDLGSSLRLHYDSHELATEEFAESAWWRTVYRPYVAALEASAIGAADTISVVSSGIAEALTSRYGRTVRPVVVRSLPKYQEVAPRACGWPLTVLYHGNLQPARGLEATIDSMPQWQVPHRLVLRGTGSAAYVAALARRAQALGVGDRLAIEPALPPPEVVARAAAADVGIYFGPLVSAQQRFVLPNKLFEYIMAGLAVVVSPGRDMAELVTRYGVGSVARGDLAADIVDAVDALTPEMVEVQRRAARRSAAELCWEQEQHKLVELLHPAPARTIA